MITGTYNGDYLGIPLEHSYSEVWLFAIIASIPYVLLYFFILKIKVDDLNANKLPSFFLPFSIAVLFISLILTLSYGVGMMAQGIYSVPSFLKPFVVLINRVDALVLSSILILSPYVKWRYAIIIGVLICLISFYRGSLMFLPIVFFLFYFRFMTYSDFLGKTNRLSKFMTVILFSILLVVILQNISYLYELREAIRGLESQDFPIFELIFGKFIGRLSNLSSLLRFDLYSQHYLASIDQLPYFAFLIDSLKAIWGGFLSVPVMNHYDYWTLINDPWGFRVYAQQTGIIPALGLSFFKSPVILMLDIFVIIICIYYVVRLFTFFLGINGKYAAMTIIIFAILSGAPNQFSNPLFHLIVIWFILLSFRLFIYQFNKNL